MGEATRLFLFVLNAGVAALNAGIATESGNVGAAVFCGLTAIALALRGNDA